jgi:SAM-dependent methyltransferase
MESDFYINPKLTKNNLHNYHIRNSIFVALSNSLGSFQGKLLDAGCGGMPYKNFILKNSNVQEYIGLDIHNALNYKNEITADYTWDGINMPFESESFDCVMATEVLEHCPDPHVFLNEVYRVLKKGGLFFFTVPFLWNLHEVPNDEYRYTPFSLERIFNTVGFKKCEINASGGWHASMAQMLGLYVSRAPMNRVKRRLLKPIYYIWIKGLMRKSKKEAVSFKEGQMITGLNGLCEK